MSIMTQLEFELDFSNSEKQLARYILENGESILQFSIQELAKKTYTSPATIVRLCKKIGLDGFSDFKIKYSAELQFDNNDRQRVDVNFPFNHTDTNREIAYKIASLQQEAIADTLKLVDFKQLDTIIQEINKARIIYIFGNGNSILAGLSFQHKMMRIGKIVEIKLIPGEQGFMAYTVTPKDIAIVISYSGETQDIIGIAKGLRKAKIPMIGITSLGDNQLSKYCNYLLNTGSREKIFSKIAPFSSKTSIEYILDILFSGIFNLDYQAHINRKISLDKEHDHRHPYKSPINDEG
ncbi:MAG: MurR/RpiR family transcriptional regulator [Coprobacillaceae bacterium]